MSVKSNPDPVFKLCLASTLFQPKVIYLASAVYLLIPNFLFLATWIRPEFGISAIIFILFLLYFNQTFFTNNFGKTTLETFQLKDHFHIIVGSLFLCFFTGVEGTIPQIGDYWAHNSKLFTLYNYKWPIILPEVDTFLCYYWGAFIVPAFLSKISGDFNPLFSTLWTFIGCYLCIYWFYINSNKKIYLIILFLSLGGLSRFIIYHFGDPETNFLFGILLNPNYLQLIIASNQFIPVFLIAGLYFYFAIKNNAIYLFAIPIAACIFWAIFPTLVLSLIYCCHILILLFEKRQKLSLKTIIFHCFLVLAFIPIIVYFGSSSVSGNIISVFSIIQRLKTVIDIYQYFWLESLVFFICFVILKQRLKSQINWQFILIILFVSILFSVFKSGRNNDLFLRANMAVYIFYAYIIVFMIAENIHKPKIHYSYFNIIFGLILLAHLYYFSGYATKNIKLVFYDNFIESNKLIDKTPYDKYPNIYQTLLNKYTKQEAKQYLGDKNSYFYKYFMKSN